MSTALEKVNGTSVPAAPPEPRPDYVALAEAERVRKLADAEADARRIAAEAEAEAVRTKAAAEAEKTRVAARKAAMALEEREAAHAKKLAAEKAERERIEREAAAARAQAEAEEKAAAEQAGKREETARVWMWCALGFAVACAIVALPVQMSAFWNPDAWWLLAAPVMLEGGAWVVLQGARAAVDDHRPHWHYRAIAWALAFIAASINLWHGLHAFDPATAIGTAFASLAGPGVWDLHEHGRIRLRDGKLTRRERRAQRKAERKAAVEKAAREAQQRAEKEAAEKAAVEAAEQLAAKRAEAYPQVWEHALKLAAALGETTVTEKVWTRAYKDIEGAEPGDSVDVIRTRNMAARRVERARSEAPDKTPSKVTNTQRVPHLPPGPGRGSKTGPKVRGVRRSGDSQKFVNAARRQAAITAKTASKEA